MTNEVQRPDRDPSTWPAVLARIMEIGSESWEKLIRVCILLTLLGVVLWLLASVR